VGKKIPRILFLKFGDFILTFAFWLNFAQTTTLEPSPKTMLFFNNFFQNFPKKRKAFIGDRTPKHFSHFGEIPSAKQLFPIVFITYFGLG
jgi:hypothetical protein